MKTEREIFNKAMEIKTFCDELMEDAKSLKEGDLRLLHILDTIKEQEEKMKLLSWVLDIN